MRGYKSIYIKFSLFYIFIYILAFIYITKTNVIGVYTLLGFLFFWVLLPLIYGAILNQLFKRNSVKYICIFLIEIIFCFLSFLLFENLFLDQSFGDFSILTYMYTFIPINSIVLAYMIPDGGGKLFNIVHDIRGYIMTMLYLPILMLHIYFFSFFTRLG